MAAAANELNEASSAGSQPPGQDAESASPASLASEPAQMIFVLFASQVSGGSLLDWALYRAAGMPEAPEALRRPLMTKRIC